MKKIFYIYPLFFALFPIFSLSSNNTIYVDLASIARSLVFSIVLTVLLFALFLLITRRLYKASLATVLSQILFFSYGHLYIFFEQRAPAVFRHRYAILAFIVLFVVCLGLILRSRRESRSLIQYLFWASLLLAIVSAYPTIQKSIQAGIARKEKAQALFETQQQTNQLVKPDIYLIILDSYTRQDVLQNSYQFDNSEFIQSLEAQGFYVGKCSVSNYPSTRYSIDSLMESNYIQDLFPNGEMNPFSSSLTITNLRAMGYSVFSFENRSKGHFDLGEDRLLSRQNPLNNSGKTLAGLNEFESELLMTTAFRVFMDMPQLLPFVDLSRAEYEEHYQQVLYTLDELPNLVNVSSPKFVFVHILAPHEPYILTPEGGYLYTSKEDPKGYLDGIRYINERILAITQALISNSATPPVIIIQGDHGSALPGNTPEMRHSILNAYYVNDSARQLLYPTISPVNSIRVIFDAYFNAELPLLEDRSFYSWGTSQLNDDFLVPNQCVP
jgi:hypothetical protein